MRTSLPGLLVLVIASLLLSACGGSKQAAKETARPAPPTLSVTAQRRAVLGEARSWIGTAYSYGGSDRRGVDCSGFVCRVFERVGIILPRSAAEMFEFGSPVRREKMRPGDLVFFQNTAGRGITHVGIFLGREQFLHASTSKGVITSLLSDSYYARHYAGARNVLQ